MRKSAYLVLCFSILYSSTTFPDVKANISIDSYSIKSDSYSSKSVAVYITGIIRDEDADTFKKIIKENGRPNQILLDSTGGSVDAAVDIGRQIRTFKELAPMLIVRNECISSCVLILAGGLSRMVLNNAVIGIHRPFLAKDKNTTIEDQKKEYNRIEKLVKGYLSEVNVPVTLYDLMFRIPSGDVRYLTNNELQEYNLNENDPYYEEATNTKRAERLGISKYEYLKMRNEQKEKCFTYITHTIDSVKCAFEIEEKYKKK